MNCARTMQWCFDQERSELRISPLAEKVRKERTAKAVRLQVALCADWLCDVPQLRPAILRWKAWRTPHAGLCTPVGPRDDAPCPTSCTPRARRPRYRTWRALTPVVPHSGLGLGRCPTSAAGSWRSFCLLRYFLLHLRGQCLCGAWPTGMPPLRTHSNTLCVPYPHTHHLPGRNPSVSPFAARPLPASVQFGGGQSMTAGLAMLNGTSMFGHQVRHQQRMSPTLVPHPHPHPIAPPSP